MVAFVAKFNHLLALRTNLPSLLPGNTHKVLHVLILRTKSVMLLLLTRGTDLLGASRACSDLGGDIPRLNPLSTACVTAVRSIGRV